jgi:hypothetical protein
MLNSESSTEASGGYAAPAENLDKDKKKAPKGYHYMPDGKLMKDSAHTEAALEKESDDPCWKGYVQIGMKKGKGGDMVPNCVPIDQSAEGTTAAALEKESDDPCWKGYVQIGMKKGKGGDMVPNCVPMDASSENFVDGPDTLVSSAEIGLTLSMYNSQVGESRHVDFMSAFMVAAYAHNKYIDQDSFTAGNSIRLALNGFLEAAAFGVSSEYELGPEYVDYLPTGHPSRGLTASATWIAGAPEISPSSADAIIASVNSQADMVTQTHAKVRLSHLLQTGALSETTVSFIEQALPKN